MKERPIPFKGEMVRAILNGQKTQTRRILKKPQPLDVLPMKIPNLWVALTERNPQPEGNHGKVIHCKYGIPGDRLWVKETWANAPRNQYIYRANYIPRDFGSGDFGSDVLDIKTGDTVPLVWKSSRFMPKLASRITLEIVNVRVERVQEISEEDAEAEGIHLLGLPEAERHNHPRKHIVAFHTLWDVINAKRGDGWDVNPWVWVIEFKRMMK